MEDRCVEYLKESGFSVGRDGAFYSAVGRISLETFDNVKDTLSFYEIDARLKDGKIEMHAKDVFYLALLAGEIREAEILQRKGVESILGKYPCTLDEMQKELMLSKTAVVEEVARLESLGFVYKIDDHYVHKAFTPGLTQEHLPLVRMFKLNAKYSEHFDTISRNANGRAKNLAIGLSRKFEQRAVAYKAALISSLWENVHA